MCSEIICPYFCVNCKCSCIFGNLTPFFFFLTCWQSSLSCLPLSFLDSNWTSTISHHTGFSWLKAFILHFSSSIKIVCLENNLDFYPFWNFVKTFFSPLAFIMSVKHPVSFLTLILCSIVQFQVIYLWLTFSLQLIEFNPYIWYQWFLIWFFFLKINWSSWGFLPQRDYWV